MSKLYFRYGAMNSGKSTALMQVAYNYEERGQKVIVVKPSVDTKDVKTLARMGLSRLVDVSPSPDDKIKDLILSHDDVACVLVDEAQFLTPAQVEELFIIAVAHKIPVIAYGLRADFRTKGFPGSIRLLELSHSIEELKTICWCGRKAVFNARKVNGVFVREGAQVAIDGQQAEYESLCGECYIEKVGLGSMS